MKVDITLDAFLDKVNKRNTNPDGSLKDPGLIARMNNPTCQDCHAAYKGKYLGKPFNIKCNGIYDANDYQKLSQDLVIAFPDDDPVPIESEDNNDIREIFDVQYWAHKYINVKDDQGDFVPFVARGYQQKILSCTAKQKVDRCGRGLGKSLLGRIEELHKVFTTKNYDVLIICPADSQSEGWYTGLIDLVDNSTGLQGSIADKKQNPYRQIKFHNGAVISIFTAGSASGRKASSIRSQSPRRIRIDEQDYLVEEDWGAISPLLTRYSNSEFHGSSTPSGDRSKFWHMCTQDDRYKEFYFPIMVHPDWSEEKELECRAEARTEERYRHEYLAEFGDPTQGVFKNMFVDLAKTRYSDPYRQSLKGYACCTYDGSKDYYMGVDWNGEGTGTRIRIVEYDRKTDMVRCVAKHAVDHVGFTSFDSVEAVAKYNKIWHCKKIYIDHGYGASQDDMLRRKGMTSPNEDDQRLKDIVTIDFGANLTTNKLNSKRTLNDSRYINTEEVKRRTKPFMVEGAVMRFEQQLIKFSEDDIILDEQLRGYRVKNYSQNGYANTYTYEAGVGDHDLDAFMLALLAVEMDHGLYSNKDTARKISGVSHVSSWGIPTPKSSKPVTGEDVLEERKEKTGLNRRTQVKKQKPEDEWRIMFLQKGGATVAPNPRTTTSHNSRTAIFGEKKGGRT